MTSEPEGYIIVISRGEEIKKKRTFEYHLRKMVKEAERLERSVYFFPVKNYANPYLKKSYIGIPSRLVYLEAKEMVEQISQLAVKHQSFVQVFKVLKLQDRL